MEFKKIELSDRQWMDEKLAQSNFRGSEYCFTNSFNWRDVYGVEVGQTHGMLVVKCTKPVVTYSFPAGKGDLKSAIMDIIDDSKQSGVPMMINCIGTEGKDQLEQLFPNMFEITFDRDTCDYIYDRESLTTLAGKKLQSKRNHINKFKENYPNWVYEDISLENIQDCYDMNTKWCETYGCMENDGLAKEGCAVRSAFKHFQALQLKGGLLRGEPNGEVLAYTMGTGLNSDTFIVHIEKAFHDIQGAYPLINQQFVEHNCQDYIYVNREDDTGAEGLRKAKLSYKPAILLEKYYAVLRSE